jgi:hypothetical protein
MPPNPRDAANRWPGGAVTSSQHLYEVRPRKDRRGVDLISDALPFGRLWYEDASPAVDYAKHSSRSHDAVIRVYDEAGNVIETTRARGRVQRVVKCACRRSGGFRFLNPE